jgi:hypothetical protein
MSGCHGDDDFDPMPLELTIETAVVLCFAPLHMGRNATVILRRKLLRSFRRRKFLDEKT